MENKMTLYDLKVMLKKVLPARMRIEKDNDGQIVIYTGLEMMPNEDLEEIEDWCKGD